MEYKTVKDIARCTKAAIDDYRKYQSHKSKSVEKLRPIFAKESEAWKVVIDGGEFVVTFRKELGKTRLRYLKKLLYEIDAEWYRTIDFGIE